MVFVRAIPSGGEPDLTNIPAPGHTIVDPVGEVPAPRLSPPTTKRSSPLVRQLLVLSCGVGIGAAGFLGALTLARPGTSGSAPGSNVILSTPSRGVISVVAPEAAAGVPALVKAAPTHQASPAVTPASSPQPSYSPPASYTPPATHVTPVSTPTTKATQPAAKPTPAPKQTTTYYVTTFG